MYVNTSFDAVFEALQFAVLNNSFAQEQHDAGASRKEVSHRLMFFMLSKFDECSVKLTADQLTEVRDFVADQLGMVRQNGTWD